MNLSVLIVAYVKNMVQQVIIRKVIFSDSCHPVAVHELGPEPTRECVVHHGVGDGGGAAPAGPPAQRRPAMEPRPGKWDELRRHPAYFSA